MQCVLLQLAICALLCDGTGIAACNTSTTKSYAHDREVGISSGENVQHTCHGAAKCTAATRSVAICTAVSTGGNHLSVQMCPGWIAVWLQSAAHQRT